jgi:hypothetical protein
VFGGSTDHDNIGSYKVLEDIAHIDDDVNLSEDLDGAKRLAKATWLAQRARPGPDIPDYQLDAAGRVFLNLYFKAHPPEPALEKAILQIRHFVCQLSPHGCGSETNWHDIIKGIPQDNRREFLEKLALWLSNPNVPATWGENGRRECCLSIGEPNGLDQRARSEDLL